MIARTSDRYCVRLKDSELSDVVSWYGLVYRSDVLCLSVLSDGIENCCQPSLTGLASHYSLPQSLRMIIIITILHQRGLSLCTINHFAESNCTHAQH